MIEKVLLDYLTPNLPYPTYMEMPADENKPSDGRFYLLEKTSSGQNDMLFSSMVTLQSYAPSLYEAAEMNDIGKEVMLNAIILPQVTRVRVNSDYNYTDTQTKDYRYQAVFDIVHYNKIYERN